MKNATKEKECTKTIKAYALLWDRCAKTMQNKISARVYFETKYMTNQANSKRQF